MTSEIVILITELRNKQRITLPAGSYRFGRSAQCEYVLRRNNVGDHQFTVSFCERSVGRHRRRQRLPHLVQQSLS